MPYLPGMAYLFTYYTVVCLRRFRGYLLTIMIRGGRGFASSFVFVHENRLPMQTNNSPPIRNLDIRVDLMINESGKQPWQNLVGSLTEQVSARAAAIRIYPIVVSAARAGSR